MAPPPGHQPDDNYLHCSLYRRSSRILQYRLYFAAVVPGPFSGHHGLIVTANVSAIAPGPTDMTQPALQRSIQHITQTLVILLILYYTLLGGFAVGIHES